MGNKSHPDCTIRNLAFEARRRLNEGEYHRFQSGLEPPRTATTNQKVLYIKLRDMLERGEELVNPIMQLADEKHLNALSHEEKQRYIFQLSSDYLAMKKELLLRLSASKSAEISAK